MRVVITGATGFVGLALARKLRALDAEVHALVREGRDRAQLERIGVQLHDGDLGDPNTIAKAASGCEVLFHCAGESSYRAAPEALAWINVAGTENVLHAARHAGVARVVHLSCADVSLANRDRLQWREDAVLGHAPLGAWARSKLLAEELALQASDSTLCVTALRPAWLWGPGDVLNLPLLCAEAKRGGVRLFGDGQNLFATAYIDNVVGALVAAAHEKDVGGRAFHVADGEFHTAREFFGALCSAVGLPKPRARRVRAQLCEERAASHRSPPRTRSGPTRSRGAGAAAYSTACAPSKRSRTNRMRPSTRGWRRCRSWAREIGGPDAIAAAGTQARWSRRNRASPAPRARGRQRVIVVVDTQKRSGKVRGGELTERSKVLDSKSSVLARAPRVRIPRSPLVWRGDRAVEGARLEIVCAREGTGGSNPFLSASHYYPSCLGHR